MMRWWPTWWREPVKVQRRPRVVLLTADFTNPIVIPRCSHGHIILGCPHDDCPEQNTYVEMIQNAQDAWEAALDWPYPPQRRLPPFPA